MTNKIIQLDERTINKIAAGEVIERPASIVKECLENALDANATAVKIELEEAGKKRIRISDNGIGISKEDLPFAPLRHATSKVRTIDDVYETQTFGFRGEALSSICHVAKLHILSKIENDEPYQIYANQTEISEVSLCNRDSGTTVDIQDLFYNLPVRARFLKSHATELSYCFDIVLQYALLHPEKNFILTNNKKECINTTGITDQKALLVHFYGNDLLDKCIRIDETIGGVTCQGYVTNPTLTFSTRSKQVVGINQRLVKSPAIQKAIMDVYRDLIPQRRFPCVVLNLKMATNLVDVNIHPQKTEVKFLQPGFIFDTITKSLKQNMHSAHDVGTVVGSGVFSDTKKTSLSSYFNTGDELLAKVKEDHNNPVFSAGSITNDVLSNTSNTPSNIPSNTPANYSTGAHSNSEVGRDTYTQTYNRPDTSHDFLKKVDMASVVQEYGKQVTDTNLEADKLFDTTDTQFTFFQAFDTYIFIKTATAVWVLDQHAVHERILYEKIKDQFGKESAKQPLLISEMITLSPDQMALFNEHKQWFESLSFSIDDFGDNQIAVREVPLEFANASVSELVLNLLNDSKELPGFSKEMVLEKKEELQLKACKAAIKAGKRLSEAEVKKLVQDFVESPLNYTCPHGRPLYLKYSKYDLEKAFLRV